MCERPHAWLHGKVKPEAFPGPESVRLDLSDRIHFKEGIFCSWKSQDDCLGEEGCDQNFKR